jgi:hypothetical protein
MGKVLKRLDLLFEPGDAIPLAEFDGSTKEGKAVLSAAKRILAEQGKKDSKSISLADVEAMTEVFAATRFNGDGIVPPEAADDDDTRRAIEQVMAAVGSVPDRSGRPGIDQQLADRFFEHVQAELEHHAAGEAEGIRPLGDGTAAAAAALDAVQVKLDDYFTRCRIATYDARAAEALNASEAALQALSQRALARDDEDVARLPVARIESGRALPLGAGVNPAWAERIARFASAAVTPLIGARTGLTEADYATIVERLAPFRAWKSKAPATPVAALGIERLRELTDRGQPAKIAALIAEDAALENEYAQIATVEKAVRLRRDLLTMLRNFVSFADFYGRKGAVFQAGTLYLDGRACELVVTVNDAAQHAALAGLSKAYLAYCECTRGAEKTSIVAAFTAGDVDHLMVGRNGVFYDRKGNDWDARITNVIENPISIRQAFWSPYKRLVRTIEEQVASAPPEGEGVHGPRGPRGHRRRHRRPGRARRGPRAAQEGRRRDGRRGGGRRRGRRHLLSRRSACSSASGSWMPLGLAAIVLAVSLPSMLVAWSSSGSGTSARSLTPTGGPSTGGSASTSPSARAHQGGRAPRRLGA